MHDEKAAYRAMMHRGGFGYFLFHSEKVSAGMGAAAVYVRVHDPPPRTHVDLGLSEVKAERVDDD